MGRRLDYTVTYDAPAPEIYRSFTSRHYWESLLEEYRNLTPQSEITRFSSDHTGARVVFTHNLPRAYLPPIARAVMPKDVIITREQHFEPYDRDRNRAGGTYGASIPAVVAHFRGSHLLTQTDQGCQLRLASVCKVAIPLVGGKLEELVIRHITELFDAEEKFTTDWVSKHH